MCGRKCSADALGFGDVGHRSHPSQLLAIVGKQRGAVEPRVEQRSVAAQHLELESAGGRFALQQSLQGRLVRGVLFRRPVGQRCAASNEVGHLPAGHLAERCVDVTDHAESVDYREPGGQ